MSRKAVEFNENGWLNIQRLEEMGVTMGTKSGLPSDTPEAEKLKSLIEKSGGRLPSADLTLTGLDRTTAITIATELAKELENSSENVLIPDATTGLEQSWARSRSHDNIIFEQYPANGNVAIVVGSKDLAPFKLEASVRCNTGRGELLEALHLGYAAVINQMEIKPVEETEEPSVEASLKKLRVPGMRLFGNSREIAAVEMQPETLDEPKALIRLIGLEDADSYDISTLAELWENRNKDPLAVIDLYIKVVTEKQRLFGKAYFPRIDLKDMHDTSLKNEALDIRREQEEESIGRLVSIGLSETDMKAMFQIGSEADRLKFRYIAWMTSQPVMAQFVKEMRLAKHESSNGRKIAIGDIGRQALRDLWEQHREHRSRQHSDYDVSIGYQADAYNRKLEFIRTLFMMGAHILFNKDIKEVLQYFEE